MMRLGFPRARIVKLGALVDRDLGEANTTIATLSTRRFALERRLIEAQREGLELNPDLVEAINGIGAEEDALAARVSDLEPAELAAWRAQTTLFAQDLTYLEQQLAEATGSATRLQLGMLIGGSITVAVLLAATAYYAKKGRRS